MPLNMRLEGLVDGICMLLVIALQISAILRERQQRLLDGRRTGRHLGCPTYIGYGHTILGKSRWAIGIVVAYVQVATEPGDCRIIRVKHVERAERRGQVRSFRAYIG